MRVDNLSIETARSFVAGKSVDDAYFSILLKLACISASSKVHVELYGHPERDFLNHSSPAHYWVQWDFGRALVDELVHICRPRGINPTKSHLWPTVHRFYQDLYDELYEFERDVSIAVEDFESLCGGILRNNTLYIGNYQLMPSVTEEATGHYGEAVCWQIWYLTKPDGSVRELHLDSYSLAQDVFLMINGRRANESEKGSVAEKLEWYSRSIYD